LLWVVVLSASLLGLGVVMLSLIQRSWCDRSVELADAAHAIELGHFEAVRTPASQRNDEVGDLLRAFGRMSTSVARHDRENPAHGLHRCADQPRQPPRVPRNPG
jgi:HAMP domain-containing protein